MATFILFLTLPLPQPDTLWQVERRYIFEGLALLNLSKIDLEYDKHWIQDSFRLSVVKNLMDKPMSVPDYVLYSGNTIKNLKTPSDYIKFCAGEIIGQNLSRTFNVGQGFLQEPMVLSEPEVSLAELKSDDFITLIKEVYTLTKKHLDKAFIKLTPEQKDSLIYTAPSLWADEADSIERGYAGALHKEFGIERDTVTTLETVQLLKLAKKIDICEIHCAGIILAQGIEKIKAIAEKLSKQENLSYKEISGVKGFVYETFELPGGFKGVIGGVDDNIYYNDFAVIIDLGGNDTYLGRCAGAVGELNTPVSFVIDLSGDDVYRNYNKLVNQGAGLFGAGILWDISGNDTYTGFHISQGAGLFGIGILIDEDGFDNFRGGYFVQGAGNFGSGILVDYKEDDIYHSYCWAQGMGGTCGYGLLYDREGDDLYYAGGKYLHMPLDPDQFRSFAQGFGFGWRDVASGGIGFLYDCSGNDKYISEVYGQATSYWFALGMLLDEQGNDLYSAAQYSQGAGIHLSIGGLVDLEGDDHYFSRFGPAQGEGHDVAVGWLLDKDGDDVYYASGGQGIGLTNSVGIFVDTRGNDDYCSREGMSQGGANWSRGTGGIGLFIDLQGEDRYAEKDKGKNNHIWTSGTYALGMDLEAVEPKKEPWEDTITTFPEIDTMQSDSAKMARLFYYGSLWEVRADIPKAKTGRRIMINEFKERAVEYIFKNEMRTFDGLKLRAIEEVFKAFKDTAAFYLYQGLHNENDTIVRNCIYLFGQLEYTKAKDTLRLMLEKKPEDKVAGVLIYTLGKLKDTLAIPIFNQYYRHKNERMRLRVAEALQNIKDTTGVPILIKLLTDSSYVVKIAAMEGMAQLGKYALDRVEAELKKAKNEQHIAIMIKTMAKIYAKMDNKEKTTEYKKHLTEIVRRYLKSDYPVLKKETQKFIDLIEGRGMLEPEELFLLPEDIMD
ncbi:MAG: HEAT repeat domain-containing protein [candidate division WOR-3 bacterium]